MPSTAAFSAPSLGLLVTEPLRAALEFCSAKLRALPRVQGDGHPVIVYPGLGAGAFTTAQLRRHLQECNFTVYDWDLGVNTGPDGALDDWLQPLAQRVRALHREHRRKVSLVGWSLGGIYAREIAKCTPQAVRQVVTLATPFAAMADGNHAGTIFKLLGGDTSQLTAELQARLRKRPPVPTTSIYSESDGVVCWRGCLEKRCRDVENVPVAASHLGMPTHPEVLRVVADRLAQREGKWRAYRGPVGRASS
ncbi:MAG: esterase/lipase family protein [Ramlibacter sp.]